MYIATWDEFSQKAKSLYLAAPMRARYCIRYNHSGGNLVVKVTDDVKVRVFLWLLLVSQSWQAVLIVRGFA
jgi:hypothetical protein